MTGVTEHTPYVNFTHRSVGQSAHILHTTLESI